MKRNKMRICGTKASTPPTPPRTPSTNRLRNTPSAIPPSTQPADRSKGGVDPGHERPRPGEHRLEDDHHHQDKEDHAPERMGHEPIDPVGGSDFVLGRRLQNALKHVLDPTVPDRGVHAPPGAA